MELDDTLLEFKENVTKSILTMLTDVKDEETQNVVLKTMGEITEGADQFDEDTKKQVAEAVARVVMQQIGAFGTSSRKRRNTEDDEENNGMTAEQVSLPFPAKLFYFRDRELMIR